MILGRTYGGRMLDMFEFGVTNFKSMETFKGSEITSDMKPVLIFQGEEFDVSDKHRRLKNLLIGNLTY